MRLRLRRAANPDRREGSLPGPGGEQRREERTLLPVRGASDAGWSQLKSDTHNYGLTVSGKSVKRITLNDIEGREMGRQVKPVAVTRQFPDDRIKVLARFDSVSSAEEYLASDDPAIDQEALLAGHYGIDAPEEMMNPPATEDATIFGHNSMGTTEAVSCIKVFDVYSTRNELAQAYSLKILDAFAEKILEGIIKPPLLSWAESIARASYGLADIMLAEGLKSSPTRQQS